VQSRGGASGAESPFSQVLSGPFDVLNRHFAPSHSLASDARVPLDDGTVPFAPDEIEPGSGYWTSVLLGSSLWVRPYDFWLGVVQHLAAGQSALPGRLASSGRRHPGGRRRSGRLSHGGVRPRM